MGKKEIMDMVANMPDDLTPEDVMERLYFMEQIRRGLRPIARGEVISHAELKKRIARWRRSAGR